MSALGEDARRYREGAAALEKTASGLSGPEGLAPAEDGTQLQKDLAAVAKQAADGKFAYNKFFAIGLFRLLELTGGRAGSGLTIGGVCVCSMWVGG